MIAGFQDLELISVAELAALCRSGEDWIRKGAAARRFEWTKSGRQIMFTREQAAAAIATRKVAKSTVPNGVELMAAREAARRRNTKAPTDLGLARPHGPGSGRGRPPAAKAA